jgi:hypothetical protein
VFSNAGRGKKKFFLTKGVIRNCKSKKDREYNDKDKKDKSTSNDLQSTTEKTEPGMLQKGK